jgi:hypothetical protein
MIPINDLVLGFDSPCGKYKLVFDDDGNVAYAYLKKGDTIVGDVWLYNRCETPDETEWKDRNIIPFANCKSYMREEGRMENAVGPEDVQVEWIGIEENPLAYVYVFENLLGVIGEGDKPGRAKFALRDGPLARILVTED